MAIVSGADLVALRIDLLEGPDLGSPVIPNALRSRGVVVILHGGSGLGESRDVVPEAGDPLFGVVQIVRFHSGRVRLDRCLEALGQYDILKAR